MENLPRGNAQPPLYQASKWLELNMLIHPSELESLLAELGSFFVAQAGKVLPKEEGILQPADVLDVYLAYYEALKKGQLPSEDLRRGLTSVWTKSLSDLYAAEIQNERQIIKITRPVVQVQEHLMNFLPEEGKFRSGIHGQNCIAWGLRFSYPQLYEDPVTEEVHSVLKEKSFGNSDLFKIVQKWTRLHTTPASFIIDKKPVRASFRIGKEAGHSMMNHPQIVSRGWKLVKGGIRDNH